MANGFQGPPAVDFLSALTALAPQRQAPGSTDFRAALTNPMPASNPMPVNNPGSNSGYGNAISSIESGGRYDILGPLTNGDRAHGKYQVMGANIPSWTKEALGKSLTPEQFLADPQAQDAVFNHKFGQYAQKYGPTGAARAWFAGEGGMNDMNRKDILGTSVQAYGDRFDRAFGGRQ